MLQFGVSQRVIEQVGQLPFHEDWSQEELQRRLTEQIRDLAPGVRSRIMEASGSCGVSGRKRACAPSSM